MGRKPKEIQPINDVSFDVLFDFCAGRKDIPKGAKIIEKTLPKMSKEKPKEDVKRSKK